MSYRQLLINLSLIFAETCFQVLLCLCIIGLLHGRMPINPLFFFVLAGVLTVTNFFLSFRSWRIINLIIANILTIGIILRLMTLQAGLPFTYLFSIPKELVPAVALILTDIAILWLTIRSLILAYRKKPVNVYSHFDLLISFTLAIFITLGAFNVSLPGATTWIITTLFLNILPLYLHNSTDSNYNSGCFLASLALLLICLVSRTVPVLHHVAEPAGAVFDTLKAVFFSIGQFIVKILLLLVKLLYGRGPNYSVQETPPPSGGQEIAINDASPWLNTLFQYLLWGIVILVLLFVFCLLFSLLQRVILWLFKRRRGNSREIIPLDIFRPWKTFFAFLKNLLNRVYHLTPLFLPVRISVRLAYKLLLNWGSLKKIPRRIQETPFDYSRRLAAKYPKIREELQEITEAFVVYRYGGDSLTIRETPPIKQWVRRIYLEDLYRIGRALAKIINKESCT